MRKFLVLVTILSDCFAFTISHNIDKAGDGTTLVVREGGPEGRPEVPAVEELRPSIPEPASLQGGSTPFVQRIQEIVNYKVLYKFTGQLPEKSTRPTDGTSAIVRTTERVEFVVGYNDMPLSWSAGRDKPGISNPHMDIIIRFPVRDNMQRSTARSNALRVRSATPITVVMRRALTDSKVFGTYPKEGLKYRNHLEDAQKYAQELGLDLFVVRLGRPQSAGTDSAAIKPILVPANSANDPAFAATEHVDFQKRAARIDRAEKERVFTGGFNEFQIVDYGAETADIPKTDESSKKKRQTSILDRLTNMSSPSIEKSTTDEATQFQLFFDALQGVQGNISDSIFPFLRDMVNGSNSSLVYNAAWSIWADLTMANEMVIGPFLNGMHQFDSIEDQFAEDYNLTQDDPAYLDFLSVNAVLIGLYEDTWNKSIAAINASGLLSQRDILVGNLQTNDTGIQSALFQQTVQPGYDDSFFLTYNLTGA